MHISHFLSIAVKIMGRFGEMLSEKIRFGLRSNLWYTLDGPRQLTEMDHQFI